MDRVSYSQAGTEIPALRVAIIHSPLKAEATENTNPFGLRFASSEDVVDDVAEDVCEALVPALIEVGEEFVVDTHEVEQGCVDVVQMGLVCSGRESEVVRLAVAGAALDACACHP